MPVHLFGPTSKKSQGLKTKKKHEHILPNLAFLEAAILVNVAADGLTQSKETAFVKCDTGKCEWNDTVCVPVSLVKDVELEFKFRGRCHKLVEDVEFSKQIHINGLLMQTCTNRDNSFLISFQGVMFTTLYK